MSLEHLLFGVGKFPTVSRHNPSCHKLAVSLTSDTSLSLFFQELQFTLEHLLIGVGKFPTVSRHNPSCHKLAVSLTSDTSLSLVKNVMASKESENQWLGQMVSQR